MNIIVFPLYEGADATVFNKSHNTMNLTVFVSEMRGVCWEVLSEFKKKILIIIRNAKKNDIYLDTS